MKKLLKKNILLNKKNILIGILATFFFSCISYDGHQYYLVALLMCPSLLFTFVVGKMCYLEDSMATQQFLLALPISKGDIIFEKNILSYICIAIGMVIANFVSILIDLFRSRELYFNLNSILLTFVFMIIYNTVYIWLNYKYDYSKTQFAPYILLLFMLLLFKFGNNIMEQIRLSSGGVFLGIGIAAVILNYFILVHVCKSSMQEKK